MVYGAIARVLLPVAVVGLIGAGVWGYQEHNEKNSVLIKAENQYQRAFHDLNYHIDRLHDELGKTMVVNTRKQITPSLANVWRLAYSAQNDVGQLPLTLMPFNDTKQFLSRVADFSYSMAVRDLSKEPMTENEYNTLRNLYKYSSQIKRELNTVQTKVFAHQLRWMDVETAMARDDKKINKTIIDGFKSLDKTVREFPELDWGTSVMSMDKKRNQRLQMQGKTISKEEAGHIARQFIGSKVQAPHIKMEVSENSQRGQVPTYSVRFHDGNVDPIVVDVTKQGGKVVWMLTQRNIKERKMTLQQAEKVAQKYLHDRGFRNMVAIERDTYDNLGIYTFVTEQNGVRLYPEAVTVKVGLDRGEVNGVNALKYWMNHKARTTAKPTVSTQQARTMVNPSVRVTDQRLAMIEGKNDGKEVLCHELTTSFEGNVYKVFINAKTGEEEEVVKMVTQKVRR